MSDQDLVAKAQNALDEAILRVGSDHVEVSYKFDDLAAALKGNGRLLDAANASAKAKAIRAAAVGHDLQKQEEILGAAVVTERPISGKELLNLVQRTALIVSPILMVIVVLIPAGVMGGRMAKDVIGSTLAGVFLQAFLAPLQGIPKFVKWAMVSIGCAMIWMVVGNFD